MPDLARNAGGVDLTIQLPAGLLVTAGLGLVPYTGADALTQYLLLGFFLVGLGVVLGVFCARWWWRRSQESQVKHPRPAVPPEENDDDSESEDRGERRGRGRATVEGNYLAAGGVRLPPRTAGRGQCRYYALVDEHLAPVGVYCGWVTFCQALHPLAPRGHRGKYIGTRDFEDAVAFVSKKLGTRTVPVFLW